MESHQPPSFTSPFTQSANSKPPKSPPLAFEKTSNDALAPLISPEVQLDPLDPLSPPSAADMGVSQLANGGEVGALQRVVEKQAGAIKALHVAFDAERDAWIAERDSLHQRIGSLEKLLTAGNSHRSVIAVPLTLSLNHANMYCPARLSLRPYHPQPATSPHPTREHPAQRNAYPA